MLKRNCSNAMRCNAMQCDAMRCNVLAAGVEKGLITFLIKLNKALKTLIVVIYKSETVSSARHRLDKKCVANIYIHADICNLYKYTHIHV